MIPRNSLLKRIWPVVIQRAEAHRKPRWVPVAKSKIYRIPKRPEVTEEERVELLRINNNYKTQMRAIRWFYHEDMVKAKSSSINIELAQRLETQNWERCVELNEKWNSEVAVERAERRKAKLAEADDFAIARMAQLDKKREERVAIASQNIKKQKAMSSTFITTETLDQAIDHAIANPVDHNFAIDMKGNQYTGKDAQITHVADDNTNITNT